MHIFYSNWYCLQRLQFHNHLFIWRRATILVKKPFFMMRFRISMHDIVCLINCQVLILIYGILMYIALFWIYVNFICTDYQPTYLHEFYHTVSIILWNHLNSLGPFLVDCGLKEKICRIHQSKSNLNDSMYQCFFFKFSQGLSKLLQIVLF